MKANPIVLGVDDAPFTFPPGSHGAESNSPPSPNAGFPRDTRLYTDLVGVVVKGPQLVRVIRDRVKIDGMDATAAIERLVHATGHAREIQVIMTDGITFGGFNLVDLHALHARVGKGVVAVVTRPPDLPGIRAALQKVFPDWERRVAVLERNLPLKPVESNPRDAPGKILYFHHVGLPEREARAVICATALYGATPEPLRLAHLVASSVSTPGTRG